MKSGEEGETAQSATAKLDWSKVDIKFKDKNFTHSFRRHGKSKKTWKQLKQILSAEQNLSWPETAVRYSTMDAPTSFKPAKKYSDISGLEATYTDPQTKLNYANADEFKALRALPGDIVQGLLQLRKANQQLQ